MAGKTKSSLPSGASVVTNRPGLYRLRLNDVIDK